MKNYPILSIITLLVLPVMGHAATDAQALQQEITRLKQKNAALQQSITHQTTQIDSLKAEVERLKAPATAPAPAKEVMSEKSNEIWSAEVALGANLSRGNNDSHRVKGEIKGVRKTEVDRLTLGLEAEYGENEGDTSSEYIEGIVDYRRDIVERLYWYAQLKGRRDALANLDYRFTLSPGIGYKVIDEEKFDLSFEGGPAYVMEKLEDDDLEHSFRGRLAQELNWQITSYAKLFQTTEFLINAQDIDDWILEAELGVETSITEALSLRFGAKNIYDNQPAAGRDENDIQLNSAIVYKFK